MDNKQEYALDQWWVEELRNVCVGREVTPDMGRAVSVVLTYLKDNLPATITPAVSSLEEDGIKTKVCTLLSEFTDTNSLSVDVDLTKDCGFDSLDYVEFAMSLEDAFEIEISDAEGYKLKTIRDVVSFVRSKKGKVV